jgi:phosphoribosyl 1,2-cyclic phosphodiesterase
MYRTFARLTWSKGGLFSPGAEGGEGTQLHSGWKKMRFCVLGSGSKGNSTLVMGGRGGVLIDAGFSCKEIERRLAAIGIKPQELSAIMVSHEHSDHIRGVGVLSRKFKLPVFSTSLTREAAGAALEKLHRHEVFASGTSFEVEDLTIHPFSVSHDAADPVGFVLQDSQSRLGYCADTGIVSRLMEHRLSLCQALIFECNHDPQLLKNGPYPESLKQRVRSKSGHLANGQALVFLKKIAEEGCLTHVVLAHISETNNHPEKIQQAIEEHFNPENQAIAGPRFLLARQDEIGELIEL